MPTLSEKGVKGAYSLEVHSDHAVQVTTDVIVKRLKCQRLTTQYVLHSMECYGQHGNGALDGGRPGGGAARDSVKDDCGGVEHADSWWQPHSPRLEEKPLLSS